MSKYKVCVDMEATQVNMEQLRIHSHYLTDAQSHVRLFIPHLNYVTNSYSNLTNCHASRAIIRVISILYTLKNQIHTHNHNQYVST